MNSRVKEMRDLIRMAEEAGWTVTHTKSSHLKFRAPSGQVVIAPSTPGEGRSLKNTRALLRRYGLSI